MIRLFLFFLDRLYGRVQIPNNRGMESVLFGKDYVGQGAQSMIHGLIGFLLRIRGTASKAFQRFINYGHDFLWHILIYGFPGRL